MKIVKQSVTRIDTRGMSPAISIELAARTCYKSEERISEGSADKLLDALIKRKHYPMLEFAHVALCIRDHNLHYHLMTTMASGKYLGLRMTRNADVVEPVVENFGKSRIIEEITKSPRHVISGSIRAVMQLLAGALRTGVHSNDTLNIYRVARHLAIVGGYEKIVTAFLPDWRELAPKSGNVEDGFEPAKILNEDVSKWDGFSREEFQAHTYATLRFITDRGVTHELVRHRPLSAAQESTRFVDYNGAAIQFILPVWCSDALMLAENEGMELSEIVEQHGAYMSDAMWTNTCMMSEEGYKQLGLLDWVPQKARTALNNSLKTEIVIAANLEEWNHIVNMRSIGTSGPPHPQMQDLARKAHILLVDWYGQYINPVPVDGLVLQQNPEMDATCIQAHYTM